MMEKTRHEWFWDYCKNGNLDEIKNIIIENKNDCSFFSQIKQHFGSYITILIKNNHDNIIKFFIKQYDILFKNLNYDDVMFDIFYYKANINTYLLFKNIGKIKDYEIFKNCISHTTDKMILYDFITSNPLELIELVDLLYFLWHCKKIKILFDFDNINQYVTFRQFYYFLCEDTFPFDNVINFTTLKCYNCNKDILNGIHKNNLIFCKNCIKFDTINFRLCKKIKTIVL